MTKGQIAGLIVAGLLFIGGIIALWYYFVYIPENSGGTGIKDGDACKTTDGKDGKISAGICVANTTNNILPAPVATPVITPLGKGSTLITTGASQDTTQFGYAIKEGNLASYNLLTSAGSNPKLIHFTVPFNQTCYASIWYKSWLYYYRGFTQDANTGMKTCYYGTDKNRMWKELLVQTPVSGTCSNFKLYLSGVEYRFTEIRLIGIDQYIGNVNFCVYKKQ